jgi:TLC domain
MDILGLERLSENKFTILASSLIWTLFYKLFSLKSTYFQRLTGERRVNFKLHVVSFLHAVLVSMLVPMVIFDPLHQKDKVFAFSKHAETIASISMGYFIWDLVMCLKYQRLNGIQFIFHALIGFFLILGTFQPLFQYFVGVFLAFEISSVFLNIHWFCDKFDMSGSYFQLVNGMFLLTAFFSVRICYGTFQIYQMLSEGFQLYDKISTSWYIFYAFAAITMQLLNYYWFIQIAKSVAKRVNVADKEKKAYEPTEHYY